VAGISEFLSIKYGLKKGDSNRASDSRAEERHSGLMTSFELCDNQPVFIYLDRKWLKEYWGLDDATQISAYLKKDADADRFIRKS